MWADRTPTAAQPSADTGGELVLWRSSLLRVTVLGVFLAGCYSLQPVRGVEPQIGTKIAVDVNDAGRVGLGETIGPEVAQVEGQLVEKDAASYLVAISSVHKLRGEEQVWSGEKIRLKTEYLGPVYERRFSLVRSIGLGVVSLGGFGLFLASRSLLGLGTDEPGTPACPPDCPGTRLGRP